jgi:hypothetical protein
MKPIKYWIIALWCIVNLGFASSVLADPIAKKSPDYPIIVETLNTLLETQLHPETRSDSPEVLSQKIEEAKLQKYFLETAEDWGICRNETGKTLGVYGRNPKQSTVNNLRYLGKGQETDDSWDCEGIYLPNDLKVTGLSLAEGQPTAIKILDGTKLVITSDPNTGELSFNTPSLLLKPITESDPNWTIPNLTQGDIDAQVPNAPVD